MGEYTEAATLIAGTLINQKATEAQYATAPCCVCSFVDHHDHRQTFCFYGSSTGENYERDVRAWVRNQLITYPEHDLTMANFHRVENPVFDNIFEARQTLVEQILPAQRNPHTKFKRTVVKNMGDALDIQTGKDDRFSGGTGMLTIPKRLQEICGLMNPWYVEYVNDLHRYHNASKHRGKAEFIAANEQLSSFEGRLIAVRYFESVRRFFVWYLDANGGAHDYLQPIEYSSYGIAVNVKSL